MRNSLCLNVLNGSILSRCMCVNGKGGFLIISTAECVVETFTLYSYKSEKHIHNMTTIFYLYDCISFNDLP